MIAAILTFFLIWEVIAIFFYRSRGDYEKERKSIRLTGWFALALGATVIISSFISIAL